MNPMYDKRFRDWRANELSREIAREALLLTARRSRPVDSNPRLPTLKQQVLQQLTMIWTAVRNRARHDQPVTQPAASLAGNSERVG